MPPRRPSPHSHGRSEVFDGLAEEIAVHRRKLAERIRSLREDRGLSQEAVAEGAGMHAKYLSRIENEQANPSLAMLVALAHALSVRVSELFEQP